jgi:hypothetical protein
MHTVSWFSAGVSSAVATKIAIDGIDEVIYVHIDDQHPDTLRFVRECELWFGKRIMILQSPYKNVEGAIRGAGGYVNGPYGAPCTRLLKKRVRKQWEREHADMYPLRYVWGLDATETRRADLIRETMIEFEHTFPLVEKRIGKTEAHEILRASGIKRPAMYELGYHNNNCIGCVKGGQGYWNKIRMDFPEVFAARSKLEHVVGATCIKGVYLDELPINAGRYGRPIIDDCGIMCELIALNDLPADLRARED